MQGLIDEKISIIQLNKLLENAHDILVLLDQEGKEYFISQSVQRILGYSPDEVIALGGGRALTHPNDRLRLEAALKQAKNNPEKTLIMQHRVRHKKGFWVYLEGQCTNLCKDQDIGGAVLTVRDITKQIQAERTKERLFKKQLYAEKRYASLFKSSQDGIFKTDYYGFLLDVNPAMLNMLGYKNLEEVSRDYRQHTPVSFMETEQQIFDNNLFTKGYTQEYEKQLYKKDGTQIPVSIKLWFDSEPADKPCIWGIVRDISDQEKAKQSHRKALATLGYLNRQKIIAREKERTAIARDVHDSIGQNLTAIKLKLESLREKTACTSTQEDLIRQLIDQVDETIKQTQNITGELRPGILDKHGLVPAIRWYCHEWSAQSGITCELDLDTFYLNKAAETALFRILQEALTNIIRHAEATRVSVSLHHNKANIVMSVHDNGKGIPANKLESIESHGIYGMRERAEIGGGHLHISRETGTRITVTIPISKSQENNQLP